MMRTVTRRWEPRAGTEYFGAYAGGRVRIWIVRVGCVAELTVFGMAFGNYGLAWSVYSAVIATGGEAQFDRNAMMDIFVWCAAAGAGVEVSRGGVP
jgi:hypothetical protein